MMEKMIDSIDTMKVDDGGSASKSKEQIDQEQEELLQKISGQRIKLKDLRDGKKQAKSE